MGIADQRIEIQRLVNAFETEAGKFHDLAMTLHFVTQRFSEPHQKFRSPNHGIMLWQYYGAIKDETDIELAVSNLEKSDQKWGLRGSELSCFAVIEGEATSLFVRMAKRAGAIFDESEAKTIKTRVVDEVREAEKRNYPQGKLVTVTNDDPLAVWLNFLLYHLSMTNPGRERFRRIQPDPFTISLLALDRLTKNQDIGKVDRSKRKIEEIAFKVAMSFPGEKRPYVEDVVEALRPVLGADTVFYDYDYQAQLARPNLDLLLQDIYRNRSDLIVVFLCDDYTRKEWCGLEWRAIRDIIKCRQDNRIMFVRFDEANVNGVFSLDGYIDARSCGSRKVAELIAERVGVI